MKRLPIQAAKDIAAKYKQAQVILVTWDEESHLMHVVSYGRTLEACQQAAKGANAVKKALGFPEDKCNDVPARVLRKIKDIGKKLPRIEPPRVVSPVSSPRS